jgi:hypothetical protein
MGLLRALPNATLRSPAAILLLPVSSLRSNAPSGGPRPARLRNVPDG